jgi:hypothetical protein
MKGKTMKQDDRVCMYYIAERLTDILKMKNKDVAFKSLYEFKDEIIHNIGVNAFYNRYIKEGKE